MSASTVKFNFQRRDCKFYNFAFKCFQALKFLLFLFLFTCYLGSVHAQQISDTTVSQVTMPGAISDTSNQSLEDSALLQINLKSGFYDQFWTKNAYFKSGGSISVQQEIVHRAQNDNVLFYILLFIFFCFGVFRFVYSRYFTNLIRVFFNSSMRQTQLTDQLLQEDLPSLVYNALFACSAGVFLYLALHQLGYLENKISVRAIGMSILLIALIYLSKFIILKFAGWLTGFKQQIRLYSFVIFLINKIMGICLLPIILVVAFAQQDVSRAFVIVGFVIITILLLMRFFRSYGLLQHQLKWGAGHFMIYIISVEILPVLLLYKAMNLFLLQTL